MTDTPAHIHQLQLAVFDRMTDGERIAICLEMLEEGMLQLEANLRRQHPDWPQSEIAVATFERMYADDFTPEKLAEIADSIRTHHFQK